MLPKNLRPSRKYPASPGRNAIPRASPGVVTALSIYCLCAGGLVPAFFKSSWCRLAFRVETSVPDVTMVCPALAHLPAFRAPSGAPRRYQPAWRFLPQREGEVTCWNLCWRVPTLLFSSLPQNLTGGHLSRCLPRIALSGLCAASAGDFRCGRASAPGFMLTFS